MQQEWIRGYLGADLERRLKVLPDEVGAWKRSALANIAQLGIHASARAYPLTSSGIELGTTREGGDGLPVLFSTGITWRL